MAEAITEAWAAIVLKARMFSPGATWPDSASIGGWPVEFAAEVPIPKGGGTNRNVCASSMTSAGSHATRSGT